MGDGNTRRILTAQEVITEIKKGNGNFVNTIITGDLDLSKKRISCSLCFKNAEIIGALNFFRTRIKKDLNLEGATIKGTASFQELAVSGINLKNAIFNNNIKRGIYNSMFIFGGLRVKGDVDFSGIKITSFQGNNFCFQPSLIGGKVTLDGQFFEKILQL